MTWTHLARAIEREPTPVAVLDLAAFDRNVERVRGIARAQGLPLRVATKSVRAPDLLGRILERGAPEIRGLMCFCVAEAEALHALGRDDLLVAYPPSVRRGDAHDLARAARLAARGAQIVITVDAETTAARAAEEALRFGTELPLAICVDMSLERFGGRVHLGVRRSPLREPGEVVALARRIEEARGTRFAGLVCYEAQVAGLPDRSPHARWQNPVKRLIRARSIPDVARRRAAIVEALRAAGLPPRFVNGGGTGSLASTSRASGATETTAGSAFYKPGLFDDFHDHHLQALEPSLFFALEVTRIPAPGWATVSGGGYVASGSAGPDKLPRPVWPPGLSLDDVEGAGEVQTPLRVPRGVALGIGDVVLFRHAKAGELCERFDRITLVEDGCVIGHVPTYRGLGWTFF